MLGPILAKAADYRKMSRGDANKNEARFPKTCAFAGRNSPLSAAEGPKRAAPNVYF